MILVKEEANLQRIRYCYHNESFPAHKLILLYPLINSQAMSNSRGDLLKMFIVLPLQLKAS